MSRERTRGLTRGLSPLLLSRVYSLHLKWNYYIREVIFGKKREIRYWQVTNDKETLPENSTWYIMTKIPKVNYKKVGNLYGLRNWVEYGLKQSKSVFFTLFKASVFKSFSSAYCPLPSAFGVNLKCPVLS